MLENKGQVPVKLVVNGSAISIADNLVPGTTHIE
jgi:hypothetical protein